MTKAQELLKLMSEDVVREIENFIRSSMAGGKPKKFDDLLDQAKKIFKDHEDFTVDSFRQAWKNLMQRGDIKKTVGGCILKRD